MSLNQSKSVDILLVGGGVMSTTFATLLNQLDSSLTMTMVERLDAVAKESTDGWNNAGTGHAAYCELNYTPQSKEGVIDTKKAFDINAAFEVTLQFWSYLVNENLLPDSSQFIHPTPHQSFVWGEKNVGFLKARFETLSKHHLFEGMEYSEDPEVLKSWMPLVLEGRDPKEKIAGTRIKHGSDCDFGAVTRLMASNLERQDNFNLQVNSTVTDLSKQEDGSWRVLIKDENTGQQQVVHSKFVFLGAGGRALTMLHKSNIPESKGFGGFPVSGQWLVCTKEDIVEQHHAKVYGKAPIGAPPMSVPHLDTRMIDGKKALLFGPFAGFTTKFLKKGSMFDLPFSVKPHNLMPMLSVGAHNMPLTKYLISEVLQSHNSRMDSLRNYFPLAKNEDWHLSHAGQRVQIIKRDDDSKRAGKLQFGTEVITSADGSLAALLGASPGASTAVQTMIDIIEVCFKEKMETNDWKEKMLKMVPSYGQSLIEDKALCEKTRELTLNTLKLK